MKKKSYKKNTDRTQASKLGGLTTKVLVELGMEALSNGAPIHLTTKPKLKKAA